MLVTLKSNWFAPNDTLYQKGKNVEIPDELADYLPKTAIIPEGYEAKVSPSLPAKDNPVETLRNFDQVRSVTDSEGEVHKRTNAEQEAINLRMAKARAARKNNTVSDEDN